MDESIELYKKITTKKMPRSLYKGAVQPIFLDLIIRLLIAKGFVISQLDRPIQAAETFNLAKELIQMI